MLLEESVSLVAEARLHLVVAVQALQGGSRDVHLPKEQTAEEEMSVVKI